MDEADAWSAYWAQMGNAGTCLPGAPRAVSDALATLWSNFAEDLPAGARVLDLATGAGAVPRVLTDANATLQVTGIDFAELPAAPHKAIRLVGRTAMSALPFADGSFGAVTSQFGIEYADDDKAIAETARVTRPSGRLLFVIHHDSSPVLAQNRRRLKAIRACRESDVAAMVRAKGADREAIRERLLPIARDFRDQSVVGEIGAALDATRDLAGAESEDDIDRIERGMDREITTLAALDRAAKDEKSIDRFAGALASDFACEKPAPLHANDGAKPIAWLISGQRKG